MTDKTHTIGEMCAEFGVTPRALRFYEYKELLSPIREGQTRRFTNRDRARLKLILQGKRFGFSLADIRELLNLYHVDPTQVTQLAATLDIARERLTAMTAQRDELTGAIGDLEAQIAWCEQAIAAKSMGEAAE